MGGGGGGTPAFPAGGEGAPAVVAAWLRAALKGAGGEEDPEAVAGAVESEEVDAEALSSLTDEEMREVLGVRDPGLLRRLMAGEQPKLILVQQKEAPAPPAAGAGAAGAHAGAAAPSTPPVAGASAASAAVASAAARAEAVLGRRVAEHAPDAEALHAAMSRYVDSTNASEQGALWPLVKRVQLKGPWACLAGGAVLVDAPGVQDDNSARDAVVRSYLRAADGVWLVSNVRRAVNDKTVKDYLIPKWKQELVDNGFLGQLAFVITQTDILEASEIAENLSLPPGTSKEACALARNAYCKDRVLRDFYQSVEASEARNPSAAAQASGASPAPTDGSLAAPGGSTAAPSPSPQQQQQKQQQQQLLQEEEGGLGHWGRFQAARLQDGVEIMQWTDDGSFLRNPKAPCEVAPPAGGAAQRHAKEFSFPVVTLSAVDYQKLAGLRTGDGGPSAFGRLEDTEVPALRGLIVATVRARQAVAGEALHTIRSVAAELKAVERVAQEQGSGLSSALGAIAGKVTGALFASGACESALRARQGPRHQGAGGGTSLGDRVEALKESLGALRGCPGSEGAPQGSGAHQAAKEQEDKEKGQGQGQEKEGALQHLRTRAAELTARLEVLCRGSAARGQCSGARLLELVEEKKAAADEEDEEEGEGEGEAEDLSHLGPLGFWLGAPRWSCERKTEQRSLKNVDLSAMGYRRMGWFNHVRDQALRQGNGQECTIMVRDAELPSLMEFVQRIQAENYGRVGVVRRWSRAGQTCVRFAVLSRSGLRPPESCSEQHTQGEAKCNKCGNPRPQSRPAAAERDPSILLTTPSALPGRSSVLASALLPPPRAAPSPSAASAAAAAAAPPDPKSCLNCGKAQGKLSYCNQCMCARYCSRDCQRTHWATHGKECLETYEAAVQTRPGLEPLLRFIFAPKFLGSHAGYYWSATGPAKKPGYHLDVALVRRQDMSEDGVLRQLLLQQIQLKKSVARAASNGDSLASSSSAKQEQKLQKQKQQLQQRMQEQQEQQQGKQQQEMQEQQRQQQQQEMQQKRQKERQEALEQMQQIWQKQHQEMQQEMQQKRQKRQKQHQEMQQLQQQQQQQQQQRKQQKQAAALETAAAPTATAAASGSNATAASSADATLVTKATATLTKALSGVVRAISPSGSPSQPPAPSPAPFQAQSSSSGPSGTAPSPTSAAHAATKDDTILIDLTDDEALPAPGMPHHHRHHHQRRVSREALARANDVVDLTGDSDDD